jgi:aminoglycoside 6-adenylyltransferase
MLLTSTRAIPNVRVDVLSDYDVILALRDIHPYHEDRGWLEAFGRVLALYRDPLIQDGEHIRSGYVTQFEDGLKIDFSLWSVEILQRITAAEHLPPELDAGYQVLLDKDGLTGGMKTPTYKSYIPTLPTEEEYLTRIELLFHEATYAAKYIWRDDMVAAKYILNDTMIQEDLRPMLEWHLESEHNWSIKTGPYGRHLKKWLRGDLWADLEQIYCGAGIEENWEALDRSIELFRRAAIEVGERLGYTYPYDLDRRAVAYLQRVRQLASDAESFT